VSDSTAKGFSTRAIRAASRTPLVGQRPTSVPIYQTATFTSTDAGELADVVSDARAGYSYTRLSNPTSRALGDAFAELAGAEAGTSLASGMGAVHAALGSQVSAGDRIVGPLAAYGSSRKLLSGILTRFGVRVDLVDMTDNAAVAAAIAAAPTRVVYAETIANPTTVVTDHATVARLAHEHGATYIVDNTFASPYICRPIELGADLHIESATKFLGGHSDVIAGVVAGRAELVRGVEAFQNDTGGTIGPFDAFLVLRGLLTLGIRMERHSQNAAALGGWLERQDGVVRVMYPGLPSHPQHAVASRQFRDGVAGGMLSFEVAGGREAGQAIIDSMALPELTASLGSVHTFVVHPPSTSQRQLSEDELIASGINPGQLRVSVGLEDIEDLQADFAAALEVARGVASGATVGV
jgi:cystathionine beta-lyase/cystathionine gamma-synthase